MNTSWFRFHSPASKAFLLSQSASRLAWPLKCFTFRLARFLSAHTRRHLASRNRDFDLVTAWQLMWAFVDMLLVQTSTYWSCSCCWKAERASLTAQSSSQLIVYFSWPHLPWDTISMTMDSLASLLCVHCYDNLMQLNEADPFGQVPAHHPPLKIPLLGCPIF